MCVASAPNRPVKKILPRHAISLFTLAGVSCKMDKRSGLAIKSPPRNVRYLT
jgi:hypothetical protein